MYGYAKFDRGSFYLGSCESFCEMVQRDVKDLAFSPALDLADYEAIEPAIGEIMKKYGVKGYIEKTLFPTFLASDRYIKGKVIVIFYKENCHIANYLALKVKVERMQLDGLYTKEAKEKATIALCKLLTYPQKQIDAILAQA